MLKLISYMYGKILYLRFISICTFEKNDELASFIKKTGLEQ